MFSLCQKLLKAQNVERKKVQNVQIDIVADDWNLFGFSGSVAIFTLLEVVRGKKWKAKAKMWKSVISNINPFTAAMSLENS